MRLMSRFILLSFGAVALSGCGSGRPIRYYTLQLPPAPEPPASVYPVTVLIGHIGAPEILEDEPIVYRNGPNEIGTYRYHQWIDPPVRIVKDLLSRWLSDSGKFRSVAEVGSTQHGDFVLHGRLYNFEEVDTGSIAALLSMELDLSDQKTGRIVWTHYYSHSEPVQGKQVSEVVEALDRNLKRGLTEIQASLDAYFAANLTAKP
jgi:cholesterol transport system auxiliary component